MTKKEARQCESRGEESREGWGDSKTRGQKLSEGRQAKRSSALGKQCHKYASIFSCIYLSVYVCLCVCTCVCKHKLAGRRVAPGAINRKTFHFGETTQRIGRSSNYQSALHAPLRSWQRTIERKRDRERRRNRERESEGERTAGQQQILTDDKRQRKSKRKLNIPFPSPSSYSVGNFVDSTTAPPPAVGSPSLLVVIISVFFCFLLFFSCSRCRCRNLSILIMP